MKNLKPEGIPLFVMIYGGILALIGIYLGITGLVDPTTAVGYVDGGDMIAGAWAGRTLGMALVTVLAIWFRTPQAYVLVFLGSVCREGGDVIGAINTGSSSTLMVLLVFLALDVICLILSVRALKVASQS